MAETVFSSWPDLVKQYKRASDAETDLKLGQGESERFYHLRISSLKDDRGEIIGRLLTTRDITEQRKIEQEILNREKLQAVVETTGAVCHEFNQPLQVLLANAELMLMNPSLDKSLHKNLHMVMSEVERMAELTQRLQNITQYHTKDYIRESRILDIDTQDD